MRKMKYFIAALFAMFVSVQAFAIDNQVEMQVKSEQVEVTISTVDTFKATGTAILVPVSPSERCLASLAGVTEYQMPSYKSLPVLYRHEDPHRESQKA